MKNKVVILLCVSLIFLVSCKNDYPTSLYDTNYQSKPQPVITSITPTSTVAAVGDITINGSNFSAIREENFVYFDKTKIIPYFASTTQLKVTPPNTVSDSVKVVVIVQGADLYSDPPVKVKLSPAFLEYGGFGDFDEPWSIDMDTKENIYVSNSLGISSNILKISPDGSKSEYATCTFAYANSLRIGPDGSIYLARLIPLIYKVPPGGGAAAVFATLPGGGRAFDMDFDKDGNLWVAGNNKSIYRIKPDKSIKAFDFNANLLTIRIFNDYIYTAGKDSTGHEYIWKSKIMEGDQIGNREVVLDWGLKLNGPSATSLTFSADGDMFVGSDGADSVTVMVLRTSGKLEPLYRGYLSSLSKCLTWGTGNLSKYMFIVRRNDTPAKKRVMKIYVGKDGAPYYGRK